VTRIGWQRGAFLLWVIGASVTLVGSPALADATRDSQWHLAFLQVSEAAKLSQGHGVTVAVVDTGVDATHPDLAGAVLAGFDPSGPGDARSDLDGHGTAMAGLIAARGRPNSVGAIGIAPMANILPIRAGGSAEVLSPRAIDLAVQHGAKVLCIAIARSGSVELENSIRRAQHADVVVIAGAGNYPSVGIQAPAKYAGVVAAVGVDRNGRRAGISVTGPEAVLAAPAVATVSTIPGGKYSAGTGTSDATAIIAGVAALVRSKFPQLSAREVIHRMTATAIDKGKPGRDEEYGYGIVNPVGALTADVPPLSESPSPGAPPAGAQPNRPEKSGSPALGWIIAALLASAGTGAVIAFRRAQHRSNHQP
jgi:type VII secretion-associated serine protease mycosin